MPKISVSNSNNLFLIYLIKIIVSTLLSVIIFNCLASLIILKLDLSVEIAEYVSIGIAVLSSFTISSISITGFKNNYLLMSVISVTPLAVFSFINLLANNGNSTICIIKLVLIYVIAVVSSLFRSVRKR